MSKMLSERASFNLVIGVTLLYGFALNFIVAGFIDPAAVKALSWVGLLGIFAVALVGLYIIHKSTTSNVALVGFSILSISVTPGLVCTVSGLTPDVLQSAILLTAGFTGLMMTAGTLFPEKFLGLGKILCWSLGAIIIIQLFSILVLGAIMPFMYWITAGLFCLFIAYEWAEAQEMEPTVYNAVYTSTGLYLSILNLFTSLSNILDD